MNLSCLRVNIFLDLEFSLYEVKLEIYGWNWCMRKDFILEIYCDCINLRIVVIDLII